MNFTQKGILSLIGKFTGAVLALFLSIILARYLGVSGVGQYQVILSSQTITITLLAMGFGNASIYFINSQKISRKVIVSNLTKLFLIIAFILFVVLAFVILYFKNYFGTLKVYSVLIFTLGVAGLLIYNILMPVLYANLEILKLQVLSLSSTIILLVGVLIVKFIVGVNINSVIVIVGVSNVVATIILFIYLRNDLDIGLKMDFLLLRRLFIFGIKMAATNLVFILSSNIVIFLLKKLLTDGFSAVGLFSRATAIANIFLILPTTLGPLFYSKWSGMENEKLKIEVEFTLKVLITLTTLCAVFTIFFGKYILLLLYGKEFQGASKALAILSISIIFSSISIVLTNVFSSLGKPAVTLKVFAISLVLTVLLSILLIPKYDIEGAAFAMTCGILFNAFSLFYFATKQINISFLNVILIKKDEISKLLGSLKYRN